MNADPRSRDMQELLLLSSSAFSHEGLSVTMQWNGLMKPTFAEKKKIFKDMCDNGHKNRHQEIAMIRFVSFTLFVFYLL